MKRLRFIFVAAACVSLLFGCSKSDAPQQSEKLDFSSQSDPISEAPPAKLPAPMHNYSLKDGLEYGYEPAITPEDKQNGKLVNPLMMFKYAGEKDGAYQVFMSSNNETNVIECSENCEFMKIMTFRGNRHVGTDRMRRQDGSIGSMVLADAIDGFLQQFKQESQGHYFTVWWTEKGGANLSEVDGDK